MALASGAVFADYTVVRPLGAGRAGEVYLVTRAGSSGRQALKVLPAAISADQELRRRFHRETAVIANLYHPHIVAVQDRGEFEGQLWIAMDFVDGENAVQLMADRFPAVSPAGEVFAVIAALAAALDYAHQRAILHRDVKPANVMLAAPAEGEQRILLTDFGIAPRLDRPSRAAPGTVGYVAPEQLAGADLDGRADQCALAATAFHLLTGAPPVTHSDPVAALAQILAEGPPRLSDQRPELVHLDGVFARALAKRPVDRYGSCGEFADAVNVNVGDHSPEAVFVVDYPAYAWPGAGSAADVKNVVPAPAPNPPQPERRGTFLRSAAAGLARRLDDFSRRSQASPGPVAGPAAKTAVHPSTPTPVKWRGTRLVLLATVGVTLLGGLVALGMVIGRETATVPPPAAGLSTTVPVAPSTPTVEAPIVAPVPLNGTYRIEVQRSRQTFDYTPDPQPPDVSTWWAFRSTCTPSSCVALGVLLDDNQHTQPKAPGGGRPIILDFAEVGWRSRPETLQFPCLTRKGEAQNQTTLQTLSVRLQPQGHLVGEMTVTVQSNECGQQGVVVRIPTVMTRSGEVPPGLHLPALSPPPPVLPVPSTSPSPAPPTSGAGR